MSRKNLLVVSESPRDTTKITRVGLEGLKLRRPDDFIVDLELSLTSTGELVPAVSLSQGGERGTLIECDRCLPIGRIPECAINNRLLFPGQSGKSIEETYCDAICFVLLQNCNVEVTFYWEQQEKKFGVVLNLNGCRTEGSVKFEKVKDFFERER